MRAVLATVTGPAGRRDLSLPADAPTTELLPTLVRLLAGRRTRPPAAPWPPAAPGPAAGQPPGPPAPGPPGTPPGHGAGPPPAWALVTADGQPIPPWASLAEHGVLHGEHLFLVAGPPGLAEPGGASPGLAGRGPQPPRPRP